MVLPQNTKLLHQEFIKSCDYSAIDLNYFVVVFKRLALYIN